MQNKHEMTMTLIAIGLATLAVACSSDADIGDVNRPVTLCDPASCSGPAPLSPNYECPDGTIAGPACVEAADGACGWRVLDCVGAATCTHEDCGLAPGIPNWTCPDGTIAGPACSPDASGVCGWQIIDCPGPATCQWDDCPSPAPGAPNYQCPDGTIGGPACQFGPNGACGWTIVDCGS